MTSRYVTTGKAADALGVSPVTLQRWAHDGRVKPAHRTAGGHFRWNLDDLRRQLGMPAADSDRAAAPPGDDGS